MIGKPSGAFFAAALSTLGRRAQRRGDGRRRPRADVLGAQRAGITGVLVRTGKYAERDEHGERAPPARRRLDRRPPRPTRAGLTPAELHPAELRPAERTRAWADPAAARAVARFTYQMFQVIRPAKAATDIASPTPTITLTGSRYTNGTRTSDSRSSTAPRPSS